MKDEINLHGNGGATFAGPKAVDLFRAVTLKSALGMLKIGITPTRGLTGKKALAIATEYTGKAYKRGQYDLAIADLVAVIEAKREEIPVTRD